MGSLACYILFWYSSRKCVTSFYVVSWSKSKKFVEGNFKVLCVHKRLYIINTQPLKSYEGTILFKTSTPHYRLPNLILSSSSQLTWFFCLKENYKLSVPYTVLRLTYQYQSRRWKKRNKYLSQMELSTVNILFADFLLLPKIIFSSVCMLH